VRQRPGEKFLTTRKALKAAAKVLGRRDEMAGAAARPAGQNADLDARLCLRLADNGDGGQQPRRGHD
jgi:hypothetical protein